MFLLKILDGNFSNRLSRKILPKTIQSVIINIVYVNKVQEISMIKSVFQWHLGRNFPIVCPHSWSVMLLDR